MTGRMRRIAVVGSGGAGKSAFARVLGRGLGLPVIHLDEHHWRPGWVESRKVEWCQLQGELLAGESWIVVGTYEGTLDLRLSRADTVIILALPRAVCTLRAPWRALSNHGREVQAPRLPGALTARLPLLGMA
jgi:adenylate kinase family enzyme